MAKGLSIVCVVIFHAHNYAVAFDFEPYFTRWLIVFLQPIRMPLFFAVSGILAARALSQPWRDLLGGKVWPLLYVFALWGLIRWVIFGYVIEPPIGQGEGDDWTQLLSMWINPSSTMWYVWALAVFAIVAKLADRFRALTLTIAFALACLTWGDVIPPSPTSYRLGVYLFFFLAGAYGAPLLLSVPTRPWVIFIVALGSYLVVEFIALPSLELNLAYGVLRAIESIFGVALGMAGAVLLSRLWLTRAAFGYLGRRTLSIYLTHVIVVVVLGQLLSPFATVEAANATIVPLLTTVSIALSLLLGAASLWLGLPWLYRAPRPPAAHQRTPEAPEQA